MTNTQILIALAGLAVTIGIASLTRSFAQERRLSAIETKIEIFWKIVEARALDILHHPTRPSLDKIIERRKETFDDGSTEELDRYTDKLEDAIADPNLSPGEKMAATLALAAVVARSHDKLSRPFWKFWE